MVVIVIVKCDLCVLVVSGCSITLKSPSTLSYKEGHRSQINIIADWNIRVKEINTIDLLH